VSEVTASLFVCPLLYEVVPMTNPGEIEFDWQEKIAHLGSLKTSRTFWKEVFARHDVIVAGGAV
jgi:hypothetical protein